jgi:hypothetical protein
MSLLRSIASGLRSLFRKEQVSHELNEELTSFLEMAAEEKMKAGMSRDDALRAVRLERGGLEVTKEVLRSASWEFFVETCWQDLRFAARLLRKNRGFTVTVVLTLALSIGANTAIFSVVNALLLKDLPYARPERMGTIYARTTGSDSYNTRKSIDGEQWELLRDTVPSLVSAVSAHRTSGVNLQTASHV